MRLAPETHVAPTQHAEAVRTLHRTRHMKALFLVLAACAVLAGCHAETLLSDGGQPGGGVPPGVGPTTLGFVTQPSTTAAGNTMSPPVQVALLDSTGQPVRSFTGLIRITIGRDGSPLQNASLSGTTAVAAAAGVATFPDLRIDQIGVGYTLRAASATGSPTGQSAAFDIGPL